MAHNLKKTLAERTANEIARLIASGRWRESLPGERHLAQELGVSRTTLRGAMGQLKQLGYVTTRHGKSTQLTLKTSTPYQRAAKTVAFLTPLPLGGFFTHHDFPLWFEYLGLELRRRGYELELVHLPQLRGKALDRELNALLRRYTMDAWLLHQASPALQAWFSQHEFPAVVIGSPQPGVRLGSYDVDNRAVCRHAANTLFRLGHQRIAFFVQGVERAGDALSEQGFYEAAKAAPEAEAFVFRYADGLQSQRSVLERILRSTPEITGLLVAHAIDVPLVMITAAELGRACPDHLSIISRTDHACLHRILPVPSKYVIAESSFASGVARTVDSLVSGSQAQCLNTIVLPEYVEGKSVRSRT